MTTQCPPPDADPSERSQRVSFSNPERAAQLWHMLIAAAKNRQTLTYKIVADTTGAFPPGLGTVLDHIMRHCQRNRQPPPPVLVVQTGTGKPGPGFLASHDLDADRERVYAFDWYRVKPPLPAELAAI